MKVYRGLASREASIDRNALENLVNDQDTLFIHGAGGDSIRGIIVYRDGIPVIEIMDADELEDYLELKDPDVTTQIRKSTQAYLAGRSRPAENFLTELRSQRERRTRRRRKI